ncbi:MAG: RAMP superfamily CRISPR-associated protein [Spirosomataceae bacterium]
MAFTHRYIARIILEAETGLFVGSGEASLMKDALVQKDVHGLPMIQGTSLTGVLRHALEDSDSEKSKVWNEIFGFQDTKNGLGSRLKISSAYMLINEHKVAEGLTASIPEKILNKYTNLPSRQHVRINERGVAEKNGLFDNEIVYKGTRFIFELELKGTKEDKTHWEAILTQMSSPLFRIGQGTRNGYGKLNIHSLKQRIYDLTNKEGDFNDYLHFNPSFNVENTGLEKVDLKTGESNLTEYKLILQPDSFFIFSEGFGDEEADNKPVTEEVALYKNGTIEFENLTLIPASSIKGALSHRTAFHYNKLQKQFADEGNGKVGNLNEAVKALFGYQAEGKDGQRGKVILNDFYFTKSQSNNQKIFNHVAIDRFTGGALDGALFSEKVSSLTEETAFKFTIYLEYEGDNTIQKAFEETLKDVCRGLLPLGGMTTKGHGIFTGKLLQGTKTIFDYESNN